MVMRGVICAALLGLAGCYTVGPGGDIQFDGGAGQASWQNAIDQAGLGGDILYIGENGGPNEFTTRAAAQSYVNQHRGQQAVFAGGLMRARTSGVLDVAHWRPTMAAQGCIPNNPTGQCLNSRGGLPRTVVRCRGQSWSSLMNVTGGKIANSANYPWTRGMSWVHVTVTGRVSGISTGTTRVANNTYYHGGGAASADYGDLGRRAEPMTFAFTVIELSNCRLATFQRRAVTSG